MVKSVPGGTIYTSAGPNAGDKFKIRILKSRDVGAELSSDKTRAAKLAEKLDAMIVVSPFEGNVTVWLRSDVVFPLAVTCKVGEPALVDE